MKIILDGVFNHCGSFNKWMDRERVYEGQEDYSPGAYISKDSLIEAISDFLKRKMRTGRTTIIMTDGGDMIPCRS